MSDIRGMPWQRHDLLQVAPAAWRLALGSAPLVAELPFVRGWAERGWPVILRRHAEQEDRELVPIGLPLPPGAGKHRVALLLPAEAILSIRRPPSLRAAAWIADLEWRLTIDALLHLGERHHLEPRVVGSLLWQHVTGLPYLTPRSDLDLLWPIQGLRAAYSLLEGIAGVQQATSLRIDGELILPDGTAVQWRELWNVSPGADDTEILGKNLAGVRLIARNSLVPSGHDA